jgi:amino-acid N-acetyltransferase
MGSDFAPGEWWTPERAADAVARMAAVMASPEMQQFMRAVADAGDEPAATAAAMAGDGPARQLAAREVDPAACNYRRGAPGDEQRFAELIVHGELPPLFIAEFIRGFVAAEHGGDVIGCGGLELYGRCGVIRSVVVQDSARNKGIGERMAQLLMEDAQAFGATDIYLFTMHARRFWERLGFRELPLERWEQAPRICWQYQFVSEHPEASSGVVAMWRAA